MAGNALDLSAIIKWYTGFLDPNLDGTAAVRLTQARYLYLTSY